ncbi:tetratricopeptide repeat protein [Chitinimonas sp.]|uniref:tetratricopeptide repeat protein n=1 Tax=Chitinimonas sp. TaxID=1934313 RepID=UPI002F95708C
MQNLVTPDGLQLFDEANICLARGDAATAETYLWAARRLAPDIAEIHANLALLLDERGERQEAEGCYREALRLAPDYASAHLNLGALLAEQRRYDEACLHYETSLALRPESARAWSNLGVLLTCVRRDADAEGCLRRALALDPDYARARYNLGYLLLRQGRYAEGWPLFEARDWYAGYQQHLPWPRWTGPDLAGQALMLVCEAGQGDMIQFCRYVAELKARGVARLGLLCHPPLKRLFAGLAGLDCLAGLDEPLPEGEWDGWVPMLSVPGLCDTRLETIPAKLPYLLAEPAAQAGWRERLAVACTPGALRVGLAWQGNPRFENDAERSLPGIATLAPLWQVPGVVFVSLQKGPGELGAVPPGQPLFNPAAELHDFADTAALMANLHLVISVDTAVAHLAGALGLPCWLMLPDHKTDWRWFLGRSDTPWYPGALRLFRQPQVGDWTSVVVALQASLAVLASMRQT